MRILHVIGTLDPASGGPTMTVTRLAAAQAGLGHDVHLLSSLAPGAAKSFADIVAPIPSWPCVQLHTGPPPGWGTLLFRGHAANLAKHIANADFVHLHGVWDPIIKAAAHQARRQAVPYAVAAHGMLDPWSLGQKKWKKSLALALGYRRMLNRAAFLHTLNRDEHRLVQPLGLTCRAEILPIGVFLQEFDPLPAPGSFYRAHPRLEGRPFVLFCGRLHYKKGLDYLADAFARVAASLPDVALVVAGPDAGARAPFERRLRPTAWAGRVHVVGYLDDSEKRAALVDAACFCLPSRQEGFSLAILEALICGLPVVISEACHFPEVAEGEAGAIVPLDAERIAAALLDILGNVPYRRKLGQAARHLAKTRYAWPDIGRQYVAAYEKS